MTRTLQPHRNSADLAGGIKTVQNPIQAKFPEILEQLRKNVAGIQAVILVGSDGLVDHALDDPGLSIETIAVEYATLLRIAHSASEDSGAGRLIENIVVSEKSVMIARTAPPEHYLILLFRSQDQIGRARYELKQAIRDIQGKT